MKKESERESECSFLIPKTIYIIKEDKIMETEKLVIEIQTIADGVEGTIDSVRQELDADAIKGITDATEEARELV